ncbi:BTB/POZ domain-containing protein 1-like [Mizuhopecten yessoensis]|uniref:BTB/POZ domain-containing protein 2 n=1 Tax=Mizuhopecten yessoensis TaxID=6573 RepID=A0A210R3J2_MIZYE|nr:BTB/POZ domain-containing protein 1-like [Mizuhopecten yessoensis]OWF55516.1 BTB/POZ domain-containing protein 2 [Mizuhopecten yessoensis]
MMATAAPPSLDWQTGKTLSECFDHILTSGIAIDVTFLVGKDKKIISAHKLVLISRSPVFYAMFEGPMAEKGEVTIPDISEDAFQIFLRYLYTDKIDLTEKNTVPVLSVARKYCVDILVSKCEEFLNQTVSVDNACLFLELAHEFLMENLKTECLQLISDFPYNILKSSSFADLCPSCVVSITESDDLQADESDVYNAVVMWAEAECKRQNLDASSDNKRKVLGDILYTVRFSVMDDDFFQKKVCHHKVLPAEDAIQTINYRHHREKVSGSKLNHNERRIDRIKERVWRVKGIVHEAWIAGKESVSFTVSDSIRLRGFGSYYSIGDNTVNVVIYENTEVIYKANNISRVKSEYDEIGEVLLKDSEYIHLKPGNVYTITEHTSHNRKCYSQHKLGDTFQCKHTTITFRTPVAILPDKRHNRHQLPYLLLK